MGDVTLQQVKIQKSCYLKITKRRSKTTRSKQVDKMRGSTYYVISCKIKAIIFAFCDTTDVFISST